LLVSDCRYTLGTALGASAVGGWQNPGPSREPAIFIGLVIVIAVFAAYTICAAAAGGSHRGQHAARMIHQLSPQTKAAAVSTTSADDHLADQIALSRLNDDGAPPGPQAPTLASTPAQASPDGARLSLVPSTAPHAGLGGGWWPRSRDATAELPWLIAELSTRAGRVSRVALQFDAFHNIPHKLTVGGRRVHVAWFRYMNMNTVLLTMAGRDDLVLLVVPPLAPPAAAARALRAVSRPGAGPADAILAAAGIADGAGPLAVSTVTTVRERG